VNITLFHTLAAILFTACVVLLGLTGYYFTVMAHEVDRQLPRSRATWFIVWSAAPSFHRKYYPESRLRKKWFYSAIGMWMCGFLGFFFWMK
jgi:hypothetical protein